MMAALARVTRVIATLKKATSGKRFTPPSKILDRRFQGDAEWQRDFRRLLELEAQRAEHVFACKQLHEAGAHEEAKAELALADEDSEQIELLKYALTHLDGGPIQC